MADTQNPTDTSSNDPSNNPEGVIPKLYSLDKDLYTSKGVSLDDFTLAMSNPAVQNKVFNKHIDKFAAKKVTFRDFQSSLNIEPSREKGSLKDYIYQLEHDPKKGYYSFNPDSKSGAVGGYQIIYDNNVEEKNKQKYGVNRDQFLSNPFVQEEYMSDRINDEYIPNLDALKEINKAKGNKYNDYELAYLIHHEGLAGAKHFLKNGKSLHGSEKALESQFAKGRTYLEQVQALSENKIDSNPNQDEDSKLAEYYKANPNTGSKSWFSNAILSTDLFLGDVKKTKTLEDGTEVYLRDGGEKVYKLPDGRVVRSLTDKNNAALKAGKNIVTDTMIGGVIGTAGMLFGAARDIGEKLAYHTTDGKAGDNNWDSVYNNDLSAFAKDMKQSLKINKPDFTPERLQKIDIKEGDDEITKLSKYVSYIAEESGNPDFWYNEGAQGISSMLEMMLPSMFVGKLGGIAAEKIMKGVDKLEDLTKLQRIGVKGTKYISYSAFNGALDSAIAAEGVYGKVKSDLYAKNNFFPGGKKLSDDEINRKASERASSAFVDNFALISGSNLLEADNLMGNLGGRSFMGKAAKLLLKAGLQAGVEAFQEVGQFGIEKYETSKLDKKDTKHEGNLFQRLYSGAAETISGVAGTIKDEYDKGSPELAKSAFLGGLLGGGMTSATQLTKEVINYPISKTINETAPESILDFYQKDENGNIKYNDKNEPVIDKSALSTYLSKVDNDYQNIAAKNLANEIDDKLAGDIITAGSFANFIQKHKAKDRSSSRLRDVFDSYALTDEQYNLLGISKRKDKKEYVDERNSMFEIGLRAYDEISSIKQKLTPDSFNKAFEHFYKQKFVFSKIQSNQAKIDNYDAQTQLTDVESANRDNLVKEQERLNGLFTFYGSLVNSSIGKQTKTKDNKDNIGEDTSIPKDKEDFVEDSPKDTSKDTKKTEDLPSTQQEKEDQKDDLSKVEIPVQDPIVDSSKVDFKTEPKPLVTDEEGNFLSPDELDSSSDIDENNGNDNADIKESVVFDDEIKDNNQNDNIPVPTNTTTNPVSSTEVDQQSETQPVNESDVSSEEIPIEPTDDDVSKAIALESSDRKEVLASIPRIKINNSVQPGDVITNKEGVEFVIKSVKGNKVTYTTKTIDDVFNKVNKPHQFVRTTTIPVNAKVSDTVDNTGSVSPISESIETDETLQHSKVYVLNNKESKDSVGSTLAISQLDNSSVIVKRTESINGVVAYIDYISRAVVDRFKKLWNPYFLKHENGDFKGFSIQKSDFPYVAIPNFDISYITDPNGKPINFSRVEDGQYKGLVLLSEVKKYFDNNKFLRVGYGKDETAFDIKYELVDFLPFTTVFSGVDSEIFIRQSSSLTTANTDSSSLREEILQLQQLRRYIQNKIDKGGFVSARITKKDAGIMRLIVPKNTSVASKSSLNKVSPISIYRSSVNNEFDLPILIPNIKNPNRAFIDGTLREVTLIERLGKEVEYYKPSMLYPVDINSDGEVVYNTIYLKNRKLGESNIMGTYGSVPIVNEHSIKNTNNLIYTAELLLSRLYGIDLTIEEKDLLDKLKVKNTIKEVKDYIDSFVRSDLKLISDGVLGSKDSAIHISTMFQLALYNPETKTHQLYTNRPQNQAKGISREAIKATLRDMWFTMNYNHVIGNNTIDVIDEVTKEVLSLNYRELAFDNIYPDYEIFKGDEDSKIGHTIYSPSVNSRIHFEVNGFEYKPETIATTTIPIQVQYPVKIESTVVENDFSNIPDQKVDAQADININSIEAKKTDIERRRQEELDNVQPIYHHTQVKYEDFNFSSFQRGKASISQFGDGLNASTDTTSFLVNRYGKPIQGEVNIKDFIEIDANKSEKELYEYLKAKGYNFSKPASEYKSNEKANEQPAIIELFQDFQKSNPKVKGVKVNNHIIGGQKVSPFYVIYDNKSFYGQDSLKNKINSEYDAELKGLEQTTTSNQSDIEVKKADIEQPQATQSELPTDSEFVTERTLDDAENEFPGENPNITSQDITKPTEIQELDLPDNIDDDILAFETEDDYFLNNLTIENSNSIPGVPQVHLNNIVNTLLGRVSRLIENGKLDKEKAKVLEINTMKQLYVNAKASLELTLTKAIPGTKKYEQLKSYLDIVEKVVDNYHIVDSLFNKSFLAITGKDFENNSADNQYNEDRIITLNPKDKTRAAIKLFLLKIKEMDDKNNTKKFFLNSLGIKGAEDLYQHIDVDKALNILFNILTVKTGFYYEPNLENVMKILDDNSKSYPFLTDIAFYLKHTPEIGPEFVRSFYSIDSRYSKLIYTDDIQNGVTYTTLIDNQTNFKSGATKLRNSWKNNLTSLIGFNNVNRLVLDPNSQLGAKLLFIKELFGDSKSRILDYNTGEINLSNTRLSVNQIATIQPWIDSINKTLVNLNNPNVDPRDVLSNKFIYTKKLLINELLKNLGINLDNDVLSKLDNPDYKLLLSNGKSVVFNSNKIFDSRKKLLQNIDQLLIGTSDVNSLLKQDIIREIASFVAQHSKNNNFHSDRMFQDGNKSVSVFQIPRYFYLKVAKLTDLSTGFLETLTSLRNNKKHYSSNPYWKHLIRTNNLNYSTAALQATEEIRRNNSEKDIHEFPEKKLLEAMIANFLSGVNNTTSNVKMKLFGKAISDSKMMTYFEVPKLDLFLGYDSETTYVLSDENNVEITGKTKISDFLIDQILMPDVNRILNDDNVQLKSYNKDVFYSVPALNDFAKYGLNSIKEVASVISNPNTNPTAYNLIENAFKEYLNNEISTTKELFQKYRIGYSSDTKSWSMVSKDAVDYYTERSVAGSDTKIAPETIHNQIVKDFVLNYLVGYSNSSMLIYGDPAIYTKGNINTTMNNVIKRLKTFASPREVLDTNIYKKLSGKDSISYLVVKDDVSPVNSIKYITNLLDGLEITDEEVKILRDKNSSVDDKNIIYNKYPNSSGYFKNNHADAQEFVHWKHHLDTLVALGELKIHDYNNIVDIIENHPEKIKNSDILKVFAPFKPLYSGTVIKGPIEQQFYIKSSHIPLLPGFSGGLEPLILFMEKNTIDRLAFESSVKLGIENTIELFENTKLKNLSDLKKLDIDNATLNLPIENYGKQLHNLIKDKNEITLTTQAQKGIFGNIKNEFVEFKGKRVKVADLEKLRDKLHGEAQEFLKQELIKALDPNDTGEMDIESLLGLMNSELESGRYDDNIKQSISFDKERNVLRVPLWLSSNPGALEAIITNIINSGGVSGIKRPGIGLVQASSIGQTVVSDQLKDFDNNIIFTEKYNPKKGLQHGVKNKKGQYVSQIIVPWYFKEKMDYFVNGKNQVDLSKLPEDLLTIFGFRIPNQFHASMIGLEIVGFLPPSFGNTVLVPTEITSQMGSDFDVDKLYSYIKALDFKVDQEALDLSKKVKKEISDYWRAVSNDFRNQYPDLIARKKEIEESYVDVAKKPDWEQKDIDLHTEIVDVLSTAREYDAKRKELEKELTLLNQKIKESARYELTDDYLNNLWNQILDIELSVITSNNEVIQRSVRQALDTPTEQLSDVADHLQKLQNSTQKQQSHISPIYNIQKYFAGSQAKSLVGNTSLALVFNFIIQNKSFSISNKSYIPVSFDGDFVHKNLSNPFTVKTDNELKQAYEKFKNGVFVEDLINGTQQLYDITEIPSDVLDDYRREKVKQDLAKELSDRTGISVRWVDSIDSLSNNQLGSIKDEVYRELDNYFFDYISGRKMYQRHENLPNYIKINNDAFINNTQKNRIATRLADSIKKNTNGKFVGSLEGTEDSYVIKINTSTSYRRDLNNRYNKDNSKLQSKSLSDIDIFDIEYLERKNIPIKTGVEELFESNPELASQIYEALGFETPTTKLQGRKAVEGKLIGFDVIEEIASGERSNIPSSILIKKLLEGEYLPKINETDIVLGGLEYGIWRPNLKKIEAQGGNKSTLAKKVGHELLHSVTHNIIYSYQNLKGVVDFNDKYNKDNIRQGYIKPVDLTKSQIEALDNLVRIRNKVVAYVEQNKDNIQKQDRGFGTYDYFIRTNYTESETDLHEFISEVFTNPELINILKEIPSEGKKSNLFKDFIDAIAKILGFTNTSILEDIIAYSEEAFFTQPQITPQQKQQAQQLYSKYLDSLNKPNTNPILQGNQKPDVILPIGTSGSGKSTFIKSLPQENLVIIEPDAMRVEFTGDMNNKSKDKEIYEEAADRAIQAIKQGKQVVFDTTNLTKDKRLPFIVAIKKAFPNANIQYKLMELNPELAKQRIKADIEKQTPKGTINVYWGQAESTTSTRILSNLAPRKFTYQDKEYGSVEHAYQSNKSGVFDKATYDDYNKINGYGMKIRGKGTVAELKAADSLGLMKRLVVESFKQNPNSEAAKKLIQYENFTHNTNELIDKAFLEGLKTAQKELLKNTQRANVSDSTIDRHAESYKQMLEDIKSEPITKYKDLGSKQDIQGFKDFKNKLDRLATISNNKIYGYYDKLFNEIVLSKDADQEVIIHEFIHPFMESYKIMNPTQYADLLDEAYTILGQELSDQIVLNYPENQVENEIITRAIARVANNNVDPNSGKTFFKKMLEFINYIKTQLHRAIFAKIALGKALDMKDVSELQTIQELADIFTLYKGKINPNISSIEKPVVPITKAVENNIEIKERIQKRYPHTIDFETVVGKIPSAKLQQIINTKFDERNYLEFKTGENYAKKAEKLYGEAAARYILDTNSELAKIEGEWLKSLGTKLANDFISDYLKSTFGEGLTIKEYAQKLLDKNIELIDTAQLSLFENLDNIVAQDQNQETPENIDIPDYKSIPSTTNSIKEENVIKLRGKNPNTKIIPINSYSDFIYNLSESMIKEKKLAKNIEYKSSSIIGIQSAAVDDANKNLLDKINFTRDTSLAAIILLQQGLNYNQVFTLLSQPVIKEYVNNLTKKGKGFDYNANLEQISYESAYNQYASNLSEEELENIKSFDFKLSGLEESLRNPDSTNKAHSIRQIKALNVFRHYSTKYNAYIGIMNAANINTTGGGKNLSTMSSVLTSVDDIMGNNTFRNANKVLQEGVHTHSIKNLAELFNFVMKKDNGLSILNHKSNIYDTLYFEISSYLNNRNVPITPWIKNKIFEGIRNVVKAYMFSSLTSSISDKQAEDIRQELLKGNDRKPPLGIILLNLKAKNYKSIANSTFNSKRISDNSFLNIIDIKKEKDSNNTFITADVNDNKLDINEIHKDLEDLFNTRIELENGYNTKHLILDLIKYDFVMGRKQSAKSFTKYLPETLIQKIILNNDLLNNTLDELSLFDSEKINSLTKNVLFYTPELITQIPNITSDSEPTFIHDVDEDQVSLGQMRINYKAVNNDTIISNALFTKLEGSDDVIVNPIIKVYDVIYEYDSTLMKYIKVTGLTNSSYGIGINNDLSSPRRLNIPVTNLSIINATTYSDKEVSTPTGILSSIKRELDRVTHSNEKATTKNNSNILTQVLDYMGALNDYSIEFVDTLENISVGGKERKNLYGYTDVANKRIVIARDLKDRGNLTYSRVLLHEIGHIVTNTYISEYLNQLATGKSDTLTKEQITTLNRVYKVYQRLESDKEFTSQLERPINNFHEFVTEVISSHDFRTKVDKNYKASIFEKINEFIKSILKQVFGETNNYVGYSDTLLGDILSIPTNNNFNTQVYSSKDDPKVYIVKKLGDDVLSVSTFNDAGNPASYVDAQSIYDKIKDYDKRDVKIYEDAYNIKKVSDNVLGEFTITTVNGIVSIKDSNNNTISETDLRHGLILGFETQEESQENSQTGDPKTDTLKFVSSISDNKIRSLDIKYKKLFSIINNRLTNVSKKIKIQEDVIKNIKAKKSISALENNTLLNNNIKKLDALESEFNTLIVSLNKIAELKGVSDLYKFFAQSEGDFVNILSKEEISFAEANYLSSLFNEILSKFNPNSPNYYLDKNEFINLGSSEKKDIIEKLSGFEARLKTTYLEQLLNHKRKMVKDSLNVYSQNRLSDEKFKEIIDSELKDISELQRWFLGADRVDDEFTNMVVNRMQQVAQQGVSQSAEYSNKLKELYQRIIPSLKKYSSPNDKFGIISVLLDNFGNFISDYTEDFFDSQNKMLSDFKQQLTAANGDKFKIRNAFLKRNRWNIQNKVALNPKYLLEEDELKDLGLKFVKSANFEQDKQKYLDYIRSTIGMYKFDRMVESVRRSARDYNEEYNTLKTTLNDQITSGVIDAAQKKEALRTFQAKYSPIIAADYNFNPKLINSVARELGKKDSSELYISDKYVKLVPKKFEGVKSLYETNQGYTKFYDKNIQKFYDNSEYDILDFIDHVNDLLHMGVHLIPEEKRFGISTRSLPFIEKDLLENLISEPISLLGLKNRVKDISASIRSLGAYKTTDQYKELPVDFVSSAAVNDKNQEIKDKINLKIKEYYLSKDILPDEIAKTTDPKLKDSDLYYPTVYKRIKQEVYDEVNKLRSFDIVKGLSMYAQQVYNYKTKAENSDEVGLLIDMVEQRLKNKGVDSINGSIVKDLEHSKHSSAQERIKMFTNFLNNYRELSTNKPTAKFKNVRGKHYSNFEKQQLEELKQYLSKLESINKDKLSDEQKIVIETEIDKIKSNIDELGKDVYLVDSILAPLIVYTQLKGLGWNFVSYINNLSIGQLNNYYESKDGRIFTADSYKDSIKDILKHSSGAKFGFGILGMIAGGAVSPLMLPGLMVGFTSGIAIGKLTQKYYETSDKDGKIDVDKIFNFYAKHDVLNKVQNENYRTFTDSSPVVSQKLQKLKDTSLGKFISNYLSIYKSTEAAEDINQGVIGLSYIRSVAIDDINGVNRPLIDFINQDGSINEELLPQRVQLNDVNLSKTEFVNRMVTEIKNTIRRTQGDYESLFKSDIKSKILGKAGMQFKTWMPETIMKDFEVAKKDQGITDILTGEKYTRKGVYMSLLEKAGLFNTSIVFTSNILTPLMLTSLLTGAFIPALALGSGGAAALFYANKKADKSKVDPLVTKALVKSVFNELPFIKRFIGSKEPNKYFSDLLNNEDAGNFRALAAKLKVNIGLLSVYMIFSILKEVVKGDDDDDDKNKMLSKLSYTLLNLAGKTYSDNSLTLDPTSSFDRFSEVKNIIPPITTAVAIGEIVLKPGIWGEQYERDQYKGSPTGYKKGDFKQLVKLEKIIPGPNRVSQLEYMMTNKYRMFDLGN